MKTIFSTVLIFSSLHVLAATTLYYSGHAVTTMGTEVSRHSYLLARTSDEQKNTIEETVVSFQRDKYKENSSVLKIDGNKFTMTESSKMVTGSGELTGLPWKWTFLRAEFLAPAYKMRIVDYNFLSDDMTISGHKDFYMNEQMFMQEDVFLLLTDEDSYKEERAKLLK